MRRVFALAAGAVALTFGLIGTASALTVTNISNAPASWAAAMAGTPNTLNQPGTWQAGATPSTRVGNVANVYRSVFDNQGGIGGDNTSLIGKSYWAVSPGNPDNPSIMKFSTAQNSLSFLWGSVDNYNSLKFYLGNALVGTVGSADIAGEVAGLGASYVTITGVTFDKIEFSSSSNAFEFSNITSTPVPIPAAAWLLGSGLFGLFGLSRRRKVEAA